MSQDLSAIFQDRVNLYSVLGFSPGSLDAVRAVSTLQVRKQYRKLALQYHPDKNPHDTSLIHKFHQVSVATKILSDSRLRSLYDLWFERNLLAHHGDQERSELIQKLHKREQKPAGPTPPTWDLQALQEYGQGLRKLKHFHRPYGDWKTPAVDEDTPSTHPLYDSCTLRLLVENHRVIQDKHAFSDLLSAALQLPVHDVYYSSRNSGGDDSIVVYVVLRTPQDALRVLEWWHNSPDRGQALVLSYIQDLAPRAPRGHFRFDKLVELEPGISRTVYGDRAQQQ